MRTFILFFLPLVVFASGNSDIHGTIVDPSGRPVEGARVSCSNKTAYSDALGRFTVAGIDKCDAHIEKPGFAAHSSLLTAAAETKIALGLAGPADTVVVTAAPAETTPEQAAPSASLGPDPPFAACNGPVLPAVWPHIPGLHLSHFRR